MIPAVGIEQVPSPDPFVLQVVEIPLDRDGNCVAFD